MKLGGVVGNKALLNLRAIRREFYALLRSGRGRWADLFAGDRFLDKSPIGGGNP